jgi:hypothetical protein
MGDNRQTKGLSADKTKPVPFKTGKSGNHINQVSGGVK